MVYTDPYSVDADRRNYECTQCCNRVRSEEGLTACPECGAPMRNISVPRE